MMSAVTAAESLGLGCCCVGYIRTADPEKVSQMLALPRGVSIVCGLAVGYPREKPDLKPKLPLPLVVHENRYCADDRMLPLLDRYDKEVAEFNCCRAGRPYRQRLGLPHRRLSPPFDGTFDPGIP